VGACTTAAQVAAFFTSLGVEPPLWSIYISGGPNGNGTWWQHSSAGQAAGNWTQDSPANLIAGLTATAAEINVLHGAGLTAADAAALALLGTGQSYVFSVVKTITDAMWTAGATLIPAVAGKSIVPISTKVISTGALTCTASTNVYLKDTTGSPVTLLTLAVANLSGSNAVLSQGSTGFTPALPFLTGVAQGKGIVIPAVADVTSTTSGTTFIISYTLV
jgi:hypothetical protein